MELSQVCVKLPPQLKKQADGLVRKGYFKTISELMTASLREKIEDYRKPDPVKTARAAKKAVWEEYMKKGNGDPELATTIMMKEAEEEYKKDPEFWGLK
ncbi:MAG: ribbon-helix-helix domain-containing protein [Candidatus Micrarchaeota archaeon]